MPLTTHGGDNEDVGNTRETSSSQVQGISDLAQRIVTATYLAHPRLRRGLVAVISVLTLTCLIAVASRLSPLPLLPLPLFGIAAYALRCSRTARDDHRLLLAWSALFVLATLVGFWLMSVVARWVE